MNKNLQLFGIGFLGAVAVLLIGSFFWKQDQPKKPVVVNNPSDIAQLPVEKTPTYQDVQGAMLNNSESSESNSDLLLEDLVESPMSFEAEEIKLHSESTDCWVVIDKFVYDVSLRFEDDKIAGICGNIFASIDQQIKSLQLDWSTESPIGVLN